MAIFWKHQLCVGKLDIRMSNTEIIKTICFVIFGFIVWSALLYMYIRAIINKELLFRGGVIRGVFAQIIGIIGVVGITAGVYLGFCLFVLNIKPPGIYFALSLIGLFFITAFGVRFLSIFLKRSK